VCGRRADKQANYCEPAGSRKQSPRHEKHLAPGELPAHFLPLAESMPEGTISAVCCLNAHPSLNLRHVGEFVDALPMTTTRRILRHELRNAERAKLAD
jgi:hypothetical protein